MCTLNNVENVRATCRDWRKFIDASPKYAALHLVRWDYGRQMDVIWVCHYVEIRFRQNWTVFGKLWSLAVPIIDRRLRSSQLAELTCADLYLLRSLFQADGNRQLRQDDGGSIGQDFAFGLPKWTECDPSAALCPVMVGYA